MSHRASLQPAERPTVVTSAPPGQAEAPWRLGLLLVLALGTLLRLYQLDGQSLWYDEGVSAAMVGRSPGAIVAASAGDIHPPLYYLGLALWAAAFGNGEVALRSFSVVAGALLVLAVGLLGGRTVGRWPGLLAALVVAVSPLAVRYAQEVRMYALVALCATLAALAYASWRGHLGSAEPPVAKLARDRKAWLLLGGYALAAAAALYTQYFGALVLLAVNLHALLTLVRRPRWLLPWGAAQLAVLVLYLPWLPFALAQARGWPGLSDLQPLNERALGALVFLAMGQVPVADPQTWLAALPLAVAAIGLLPLAGALARRDSRHAEGLLLALLLVAVPLVGLVALRRVPLEAKFVMVALPGFALLVGRGIDLPVDLVRRMQGPGSPTAAAALVLLAGVALVGTTSAVGLRRYYFDPALARDDYRGLARYIATHGRAGDAIIVNAPGQQEIVRYYYHGPLPVYPLPEQRPIDAERTRATLASLRQQHQRLWLVLWGQGNSDPEGVVEGWLNAEAFKVMDAWYGGVRLLLYDLPTADVTLRPLQVSLDNGVDLLGYAFTPAEVAAGEVVQLTLRWRARQPVAERYKVFTHLLDERTDIYGQMDSEPVGGQRPTTTWMPGEEVVDRYGILVLPGTPPGAYRVELGMYLPDGRRALVLGPDGKPRADHVVVGPVRVVRPSPPPSPSSLTISHPLERDVGPLRLLGSDLHPLGRGVRDRDFRPGETALLTLYWWTPRAPGADHDVHVRLVDAGGEAVLTRDVAPQSGAYPTSLWRDGEVVRDLHRLHLPPDLAPGRYRVLVGVHTPGDAVDEATLVEVGAIEVR